MIEVRRRGDIADRLPLSLLRDRILSITPGQKVAYVTDAAYSATNAAAIVDLAKEADVLFIETMFAEADAAIAADRAHLTTAQAGDLARRAGVARMEPFHFSPRYAAEADRLVEEAQKAFRG